METLVYEAAQETRLLCLMTFSCALENAFVPPPQPIKREEAATLSELQELEIKGALKCDHFIHTSTSSLDQSSIHVLGLSGLLCPKGQAESPRQTATCGGLCRARKSRNLSQQDDQRREALPLSDSRLHRWLLPDRKQESSYSFISCRVHSGDYETSCPPQTRPIKEISKQNDLFMPPPETREMASRHTAKRGMSERLRRGVRGGVGGPGWT